MTSERRIAIVVPRYGPEIGGGAEALAREYAVRLSRRWEVTVLTTCALDYHTWADHYAPGVSTDGDVTVVRFPVSAPRDPDDFAAATAALVPSDTASEAAWMAAQGPNAPGLLEHLAAHATDYRAVLFVPYVYATTVRGLPLVADRAVLVPAFHDEPGLRLTLVRDVVESARAVVCSTPEERALALSRFRLDPHAVALVGAGVEAPTQMNPDAFRSAFGIARPYVVVVGRVDGAKGTDRLIGFHDHLRRLYPGAPDLVLIGRVSMKLPKRPWLHATGFVDEAVKYDAIRGADALICPSSFESLSLVLLEAWAVGIPTVCSAASDVLVNQTRRAAAGVWYRDADEYAECVRILAESRPLARALGAAGRRFVQSRTWPAVIERLSHVLEEVAGTQPSGRA